jgi:membrane protein DedA with SNARE-associated domain
MKEKHRHKFNRMFFKHGTAAVFIARFLPGFRMVAYFVAGNLRMRFWKFLVIDSIGAALTVPISVWAGWVLADNLDRAQELFHKFQIPIFIFIGLLALFLFRRRKQLRLRRLEELRSQRAERDR